jgi:hypothetical protein
VVASTCVLRPRGGLGVQISHQCDGSKSYNKINIIPVIPPFLRSVSSLSPIMPMVSSFPSVNYAGFDPITSAGDQAISRAWARTERGLSLGPPYPPGCKSDHTSFFSCLGHPSI